MRSTLVLLVWEVKLIVKERYDFVLMEEEIKVKQRALTVIALNKFNKWRLPEKFFMLFMLLAVGSCTALASAKEVELDVELEVVTEHLPPYQFIGESGAIEGYSTDVVRALLERLNLSIEINIYPWARAYKYATTKSNVLIYSIARTPLRENKFHWVGKLYKEEYAFYTLHDNVDVKAVSLDDIRQYYVGVTLDTGVEQFLTQMNFTRLEKTNSVRHAFQMLFSKRIDLMIGDEFVFRQQVIDMGHDPEKLKRILDVPEINADLYIAMSKATENSVLQRVRQEFKKMKTEGVIDAIKNKWKM